MPTTPAVASAESAILDPQPDSFLPSSFGASVFFSGAFVSVSFFGASVAGASVSEPVGLFAASISAVSFVRLATAPSTAS